MQCEKNTVTNRAEVQRTTCMSREHKAYTYLRIDIYMKYKKACIVYYYLAVFLGYQVKKIISIIIQINHTTLFVHAHYVQLLWTWLAWYYSTEK